MSAPRIAAQVDAEREEHGGGGRERPGRRPARRRLSRSPLLAVLAVFALVAAACGSDDDDAAAPAVDDTTEDGTGSEGAVERSGTFRYPITLMTQGFDPIKQTNTAQSITIFPVYDRLIHLSPDGQPIPGLAESWEFNDDATALTLELRPDVVFHDGTPFDAEAVRANIERGQTTEGSVVAGELEVVTSVEVIDDLTVSFELGGPAASLPLILTGFPGAMASPAAFDTLDEKAVGAGPFVVDEFQQDVLARYVPFEDYWDPDAVNIEALEVRLIGSPEAQLSALISGELDAIPISPQDIPRAESEGLRVEFHPSTFIDHIWLNRTQSNFGDVRVRQALNHALDREAIVEALSAGYDEPAYQMFPDGYFAASPDLGDARYEYDPDRARELLAEAGHPDGFDFELVTVTIPSYVVLTEVVQAQLAEVGLNATIRQMEVATILDMWLNQQAFPAQVGSLTGRPDPSQVFSLLFTADGFLNPGGHTTEAFTELANEALKSQSPEEREEALQAASQQLMEDALAVPIKFPANAVAMRDDVAEFPMHFSRKPEFTGVAFED